jgi:hypothetical protein
MPGSGVSPTLRQEEMPKMGTSHRGVLHGLLCWGTQSKTSVDQPMASRARRPASTLTLVLQKGERTVFNLKS